MIIELEKFVDLDANIVLELIGAPWGEFSLSIPEEQYNVLNSSFKLLFCMLEETGELSALIQDTLQNPELETHPKKIELHNTALNSIISLLNDAGVYLNEGYDDYDYLPYLNNFLSMMIDLNITEDVYGLVDTLTDQDQATTDRFLFTYNCIHGEKDSDVIECMLEDVSENLLKNFVSVIRQDEFVAETISPLVKNRILNNKSFFTDTIGKEVVINNSAIEASIDSLKGFYQLELESLSKLTFDLPGAVQYVNNLISIYLVSSLNTDKLKEKLTKEINDISDDIITVTTLDNLLGSVKLD